MNESLLAAAPLTLLGRIRAASNQTFLCRLGEQPEGDEAPLAVYKPISGERPLWDFTDGTLADREYAAWLVSDALGWDVVPPTLLREGPYGFGMVQLWQEPDPLQEPIDVVPAGAVPPQMLHVLDAVDGSDRPVALVHEDSIALRRMAVLDAILNNTDRKGGHVLPMPGGHRYGVDHGVCFHTDDKLRTVLWGWAGKPFDDAEIAGIRLTLENATLDTLLADHLTGAEIRAMHRRSVRLLAAGVFPIAEGGWPSIPWPPF